MSTARHPLQQPGWRRFLTQCLAMKTEQELTQFFELFLTEEEKEALATRALIIDALREAKHTQREIAKTLQVSISKITRGSNMLKRISPSFLQKLTMG